MTLKTASIYGSVVDVPCIAPVRKAGWPNRPFVVIRVHTDDGLVGLGECRAADKQQVELAAQAFIGRDPLALNLQTLDAPLQSAFSDLAGQALGVPAWRLIGDQYRDRVPVAKGSCHMPPAETAREADPPRIGGAARRSGARTLPRRLNGLARFMRSGWLPSRGACTCE